MAQLGVFRRRCQMANSPELAWPDHTENVQASGHGFRTEQRHLRHDGWRVAGLLSSLAAMETIHSPFRSFQLLPSQRVRRQGHGV
jgi:hypothetical protein